MKTRIAIKAAALALATQVSSAATITEFDGASDEQKGAFLVRITKDIYDYYAEKQPAKAACMEKLASVVDDDGITDLVNLVIDGIDSERGTSPDGTHVEDVMFRAIERACEDFKPQPQ